MGSPSTPLQLTFFMEEFETKAISTAPINQGYGVGMWMTPLSSRRQNTASSSYNTAKPLTHTYSSLLRFPTLMDPYHLKHPSHSWTRQHTANLCLQETYAHSLAPPLEQASEPTC